MEGKRRARRRGFFRPIDLLILGSLIIATSAFVIIFSDLPTLKQDIQKMIPFEWAQSDPRFKEGQSIQVQVSASKTKNYKNWIGTIKSIDFSAKGEPHYLYTVAFENGDSVSKLKDDEIGLPSPSQYEKEETVQLTPDASTSQDGTDLSFYRTLAATIKEIHLNTASGGGYKYDIQIDDLIIPNVEEKDIRKIYSIDLKEENTAGENDAIIRQAFDYASNHPQSILQFASGHFLIGSQTPEKDYQLLPSDTQIVGNHTTLRVSGKAYWLGLATGPEAADGVKNLQISDLIVEAEDLTKGANFMIMTNHGDNWIIQHNQFIMAQPAGGHVFDLGGLQNSLFEANAFIGFAPELTNKLPLPTGPEHTYYSEAIQLDRSSNNGVWDANIIKNVNSQVYDAYNKVAYNSTNITISNNIFKEYRDVSGTIIAYGPSIGQHSSDVTDAYIYHNTFQTSLVSRLNSSLWVLQPIHFSPTSTFVSENNTIQ